MSEKPTIEELTAQLEAEKAARKGAEEVARKAVEAEKQAKKDTAVAKRAKTAAEKKTEAAAEKADETIGNLKAGKAAAEKQAAEALEAAEAAESEAAAARRSAERADQKVGSDDKDEDEVFVYAHMAKRDPNTGHFRASHSATYGGRFFSFKAGTTQPVPAGLAESLEAARDQHMKGTAEGARIFTITDKPSG